MGCSGRRMRQGTASVSAGPPDIPWPGSPWARDGRGRPGPRRRRRRGAHWAAGRTRRGPVLCQAWSMPPPRRRSGCRTRSRHSRPGEASSLARPLASRPMGATAPSPILSPARLPERHRSCIQLPGAQYRAPAARPTRPVCLPRAKETIVLPPVPEGNRGCLGLGGSVGEGSLGSGKRRQN